LVGVCVKTKHFVAKYTIFSIHSLFLTVLFVANEYLKSMKLGITTTTNLSMMRMMMLGGLLVCLPFVAGFVSPGGNVVVLGPHSPSLQGRTTTTTTTTILTPLVGKSRLSSSTPLFLFPMDQGTAQLVSTAVVDTSSFTSSPLFLYFMQALISNGVPTFFVLITVFFTAKLFKDSSNRREDMEDGETAISELYSDLYGDSSSSSKRRKDPFSFMPTRSNKPGRNLGIPQEEYIKIRNWNQKLDSYQFSMTAATQSKAAAAAEYRTKSFTRALQKSLKGSGDDATAASSSSLSSSTIQSKLLRVEQACLKQGIPLVEELQFLQTELAKITIDSELKKMGMTKNAEATVVLADNSTATTTEMDNVTSSSSGSSSTTISSFKLGVGGGKAERSKSKLLKEMGKIQMEITRLELAFVAEVVAAVGKERAGGVRAALLGDIATRGTGSLLTQLQDRPLSVLLSSSPSHGGGDGVSSLSPSPQKSVFVAQFRGDVTASQVNELREEVTAVVRNSKPGIDEALIVLQTGGGTVTGYGLAAAQLLRLKNSGLKLTIAVEQVAASGGYMMSCVADRIVASPMAVLGSIGVITEIPNVYERLKKEGM
jgi:hypothetical protein